MSGRTEREVDGDFELPGIDETIREQLLWALISDPRFDSSGVGADVDGRLEDSVSSLEAHPGEGPISGRWSEEVRPYGGEAQEVAEQGATRCLKTGARRGASSPRL